MDIQLYMTTSQGSVFHTDIIFKNCTINMEGRVLSANFIQLEILGWNIILGIDWLAKHKVNIDYEKKLITSSTPEAKRVGLKGNAC